MHRSLYILWLIILVFSCNTKKTLLNSKTLDFASFKIETPITWKKVEVKGIDSYVGGIQIDSNHIASFDLGLYSNDLSEYVKVNLNDSTNTYVSTSNVPPLHVDSTYMEKIKKCKVVWDTVDGRLAKFVIPLNPGLGVTGVYFDSLWKTKSGEKIKLQISANNLKFKDQTLLLKAYKTIQFIKEPQ